MEIHGTPFCRVVKQFNAVTDVTCALCSSPNMAASELSIEEIHKFFVEKGGRVSNKELVKHFKRYLTNHETKGMFY